LLVVALNHLVFTEQFFASKTFDFFYNLLWIIIITSESLLQLIQRCLKIGQILVHGA